MVLTSGTLNPPVNWAKHLFGLMLCLPFLVPLHDMPLPSFQSEWLALVLGLLALLALCLDKKSPQVSPMVLAPLALLLLVLLQLALGKFAYVATALTMSLYLLWCALLLLAGRTLVVRVGMTPLLTCWCKYLLAGGLLNALCGLAQFSQIWPALGGWVAAPMEARDAGVYGNLAQQNHFATHLALAMAAACYLCFSGQRQNALPSRLARHWPLLAYGGICLVLFAALLLSASRSSLLYVVWIGLLGLGLLKRVGSALPARKIGILLLILLAILLLALVLVFSLAGHGVPQIDRLKTLLGGLGVRAYLWRHAWAMFCSHPLLGVGFDGFAWHLVQQLHDLKEPSQWGIDQYAHNLGLQLLAVAGLPGLLALAWPLGRWLRRQLAQPYQVQRFLPWAALGILLIHSMLEQPLYFSYFLGAAALLLGLADPQAWQAGLWLRRALILVCLLGLAQMLKIGWEYDQLEGYFYSQRYRTDDPGVPHQLAQKLSQDSLLGPMVELAAPAEFVPDSAGSAEKIRFNQRLRHFAPVAEIEYREAALLAAAGQTRQAMKQFDRAAYAYPGQTKVYLPRFFALAQSDPASYAALAEHGREFVMKMHGRLDGG